ncbi:MAG: tRNA lysidine(34) synthetase TilS [Geodermatophilaceae bacterium]|nr:tRNA lysidine(34) synthetase TilS [Geodermatophilaceae bacterium]
MPGPPGSPDPAVAAVRTAVRRAVAAHLAAGEPITVACSGGADSIALATAVAFEAARWPVRPAAVVVDHGLQPDSAEAAAAVADTLRQLRLEPVTVVRVDVPAAGGGGPEARARTARYAALQASSGGGWVALGHTLDDQAETVLLGLGRGSGPRSIAGMSEADRPWLRPLLGVRRSTTRAACAAEGMPVWDDPHNADPSYTRVRLRQEVLPLLEDVLQGGVAAALARTADLLREDCAELDAQAAVLAVSRLTEPAPSVSVFTDQPPALRGRLLRLWLAPVGALTAAHLAAVEALVTEWRGQGAVALPGGAEVRRASGRLHLRVRR